MNRLRIVISFSAAVLMLIGAAGPALAQFSSGSDGSDGVFNPTESITIDMADHPDGIYQYVSVNIPAGVVVTFTPNAANTPVRWLVQTTCVIDGEVNVDGKSGRGENVGGYGGQGGPGGWPGGRGAITNLSADPGAGLGPGGGKIGSGSGNGSGGGYGSAGKRGNHIAGPTYGNAFLLPLAGGSGGSGSEVSSTGIPYQSGGGGGGGGAILIAASASITVNGNIRARSGGGYNSSAGNDGGDGSGGAIRLVAPEIFGSGTIDTRGEYNGGDGQGRVRLETGYNDPALRLQSCVYTISRTANILILPANIKPELRITSVAGIAAPGQPTGSLSTYDVDIPGTEVGPFNVQVVTQNLDPGTEVQIEVIPEFGEALTQIATVAGTSANGTAQADFAIPPGNGYITARTTAPITKGSDLKADGQFSYLDTGLAPTGEPFAQVELAAGLGGQQHATFITASGKRYSVPAQ